MPKKNSPARWVVANKNFRQEPEIIIAGCGGTGGFIAEGLCRLFTGRAARLALIDMDTVEERNLLRQNFFPEDIGKFKSQALAERLARRYGREVVYSVNEYRGEMLGASWGEGMNEVLRGDIVIGCVDNAAARRSIAKSIKHNWWLDTGNGEHYGQVLLGNAAGQSLKGCLKKDGTVSYLPLPTVQEPSLLIPAPAKKRGPTCAEAVELGDQSPAVNQVMASLAVEFVRRIIGGTLEWMGVYIDLDTMTMTPVPITPAAIARMSGLKAAEILERGKGK